MNISTIPACRFMYQNAFPSLYSSLYSSVYCILHFHIYLYMSIYLSIYLYLYMSIYLYLLYISLYLLVCISLLNLYLCISIYISLFIYIYMAKHIFENLIIYKFYQVFCHLLPLMMLLLTHHSKQEFVQAVTSLDLPFYHVCHLSVHLAALLPLVILSIAQSLSVTMKKLH